MLPKKLKQLLLDGQRDTKCTLQPCQECIKDPCCRNPGYATFENTLEIYKAYEQGKLKREDGYEFIEKLTYKEFVLKYFNIAKHPVDESFVLFFPKIIIDDDELLDLTDKVGLPNIIETTNFLTKDKYIKNYGCVFGKRKITGKPDDVYKNCMLWSEERFDKITTHPIGCINNGTTKEFAEVRETLLHHFYPNSTKRFIEKEKEYESEL